jgi:NodT family efflux transporter outer membrane factor (OMF) lipoprotein
MKAQMIIRYLCISAFTAYAAGCKVPAVVQLPEKGNQPATFTGDSSTLNSGETPWRSLFTDPFLTALIDTALKNNLELKATLQEIEVARSEVRFRDSWLYPSVNLRGGLGIDKVGRYTSEGAGNASTDMTPGKRVPEPLGDLMVGFQSTWEVDVWSKLHNAKKAAFNRYLATREARNYIVTNLVAEIANTYFELLALDNQLEIIRATIRLQQNELEVVRVQKQAAMATELAVKQFEAQVFNAQGLEYDVLQQIKEKENTLNALLGRYPQPVLRDTVNFVSRSPLDVSPGVPSQLLKNRPDIRQSELELEAAQLDVQVARAEFYPSFGISAGLGFQAFKPAYLLKAPESIAASLVGDAIGPIINRRAIQAEFNKANALQLQALFNYQKTVLNAYVEVSTQLSNISNLQRMQELKAKEVETLTQSIDVAKDLFRSTRANYLEVLIAQRDALSAKLELAEARKRQFNAVVNIYKALGGGWQ